MKLICCVCKCDLGEKPPLDDKRETYGYCAQHLAEAYAELDALEAQPPRIRKQYSPGYWENVDWLCDEARGT